MEDFSKYLLKANTPSNDPITSVLDGGELFTPDIDNGVFDSEMRETNKSEDRMKFSVEDDIAELEWNIEKCNSEIEQRGVKDVIISTYYRQNLLFFKKINEITKRINEKYTQYKDHGPARPTYYARDLRFEDGMSYTETSCMRAVRETCEAITSYFDKEYSKEVSLLINPDYINSITNQQFWSKVEDIVHTFNPSEISEALLKNIQQTTENLKELSSRIDLKRDAENLKFKFETGKLKDISSVPALLKTVCQLIEMGQISHFQQFIACEKANNEVGSTKQKLHALNREIDEVLKNKFDSKQAELMRKYFHAQQEHGSCIASRHYLDKELIQLRAEKKEKEETMALLLKKYDRIQNFDKTVQAKQLVIRKLIQIQSSAKSRHRQQYGEINILVEQKIIKKQKEIADLCHKYKDLGGEELDNFMKIPIQNLHHSKQADGDMKLVSDLSINFLNPNFHHAGDDSLKHILKKVDIPVYTAPENVISHIMEMKHNCYTSTTTAHSFGVKAKGLSDIHAKIANLTENLSKLYKEQFESLMPRLKGSGEKTSEIMAECLKFQNSAQAWWQQPAQHLVPWVKVDGFNIQQYGEQFSMHGELLKQMHDGLT